MSRQPPALRADPAYLKAFTTIMSRIERSLGANASGVAITVCIAGGAAMHFYVGGRFSEDIDAKFMGRVLLDPSALQVAYKQPDGRARVLYLDTQYSDTFALLHESAYDDARPLVLAGIDARRLDVRLLAPLDLAVSKLARFAGHDQQDIRALAEAGLIDAKSLGKRAAAALPGYVGNLERVRNSIEIACRMIGDAKPARRPRS